MLEVTLLKVSISITLLEVCCLLDREVCNICANDLFLFFDFGRQRILSTAIVEKRLPPRGITLRFLVIA